jgi:predicted ester cyclase
MTNIETNQKAVRRFYEAYNQNDEGILEEVLSVDYVDNGHNPPGKGLQGARDDLRGLTNAFSDLKFKIEELIATEDDRVVARWAATARHTGDFQGFRPTLKTMKLQGISIYKLRGGKIIETRNAADFLSPLMQLGLIGSKKAA